MSSSRRRSGPARCRTCGAPVVFFRSPFTNAIRTFNPTVLSGSTSNPTAYPVLGRQAFRVTALMEHLQVQRGCSAAEAADEIRDLPWHQLHACSPTTSTTDTPKEIQ